MRLYLEEKNIDQFLLEGKGKDFLWLFRAKPKLTKGDMVTFCWGEFDLAGAIVWYVDPPGRPRIAGERKGDCKMWQIHFMQFKYLTT